MLGLSDQQLVTGLAMLVAAFGRWRDITIYSANVVVALAYFSSTVHTGTLYFVETYLRRHGFMKNARVFAMLATLTLLVFLMVLQLSSTWEGPRGRSNLYLICAFYYYNLNNFDNVFAAFTTRGYVIISLLWTYCDKFTSLYSGLGPFQQNEDVATKTALKRHGIDALKYRDAWYKDEARKLLQRPSSRSKTWAAVRLIESFAFHETYDSRFTEICSLLNMNIYGALLIFAERSDHAGTTGQFSTMGFGQIVPVFLLVLPIFGAVESIYGKV
jgi:hypothetical protein